MERIAAVTAGTCATKDPGASRLAAAVLLVVTLCAGSVARNSAWSTEAALLEDSISKTPDKPRLYYNLGCIYNERQDYSAAIAMFTRSIELYPLHNRADDARSREFYFNVYLNRGSAYAATGRPENAIEDFSTAIALNPGHGRLYLARGDARLKVGTTAMAIADYETACALGCREGCDGARLLQRGNRYGMEKQ